MNDSKAGNDTMSRQEYQYKSDTYKLIFLCEIYHLLLLIH